MTKNLIEIKNFSKEFLSNKNKINILSNINFKLNKGDIYSIIGPSGSGKSSFLNILGLLDSDYTGSYKFLDNDISKYAIDKKNIVRNKSIGFIHQFFHLLPELNVLENVALPNLISHNEYDKSIILAKEILIRFGLKNRMSYKPNYLSGGEQQRVAIARAMINRPELIIADEMTGNLDEQTASSVFDFFIKTIKFNKQSLLFVTHNLNYANKANKVFEISNQKLIEKQ
jgi:ABC-type lipoprotein export system ATPase subunit